MIQINMSIPKCCGECPLLGNQGGYPICYITRAEIYSKAGKLLCCPLKEKDNSLQNDKNVKDYKVCSVCRDLEKDDDLYICRYDDVGYSFEQISNIEYCPKCGRRLLTYQEKEKKAKETFSKVAKEMLEAIEKE